ncbi:hypothetical protein K439DRAFT_1632047 [Ramaria rubella]|nr:hypothetical protein K439DRAFT_1632047 [Ramaria rubella]
MNSSQVVHFNSLERKGTTAIAVVGVTSCTFISLLLLYIIASALAARVQKAYTRPEMFITKQIAVFLTSLLVSDLIQSIAGVYSVKWAVKNQIYEGQSCTVQGATLVFGDLGSTVWSVVIAAHTFCGITLNRHWSRWMIWVILCAGWLFPVVLTFLIPLGITRASKGPYFSIAGTWCFISSEYAVARLVLHYVPIFTAAATILVLYVLIFLFLRGSIHFLPAEGPEFSLDNIHSKQRLTIAKRMLWYPIAYCTCVIPIATIRVLEFHINLPEEVMIVGANFLFALGGVDAIIYASTRALIRPINISFGMRFLGKTYGATSEGPMVTPEQPSPYNRHISEDQDVASRSSRDREVGLRDQDIDYFSHGNGMEDTEGKTRQKYP